MFRRAVLSISKATFLFKIVITSNTLPSDKSGFKIDLVDYWLDVFTHVSHKVESSVATCGVPKLCFDSVIAVSVGLKPCFQSRGFSILCGCLKQVVFENISLSFVNKHSWDFYPSPSTVVLENLIVNIFINGINNKCQSSTCSLNISSLRNERAVASFHEEDRGKIVIWISGKVLCKSFTLYTTIRIRSIVV